MKQLDLIVECLTIADANNMDTTDYRLSERLSGRTGSFIFVRRVRK